MKHAGPAALAALESLLAQIRQHSGLKEKKCGIFYWKSSAFLHFHEDRDQYFADVRIDGDWVRFPVNSPSEQETLLAQIASVLKT